MAQIQTGNQPVTQVTIVDCEPDKQTEALSVMRERARFMARQPGFISISLHRSLDGRRIINYVQWQNREMLRSAHRSPQFRKEWTHFDRLTDEIDPHLYEVAEVIDGDQPPHATAGATSENPEQVSAGTPGAGENICRRCGGKGQVEGGACPDCGGTGKVVTPIGGA
jgi:heme-degrading monooxygenase HmoA